MGGELSTIRTCLAGWLNENGIRAVTAWPGEPRSEWGSGPVSAVSVRECRAAGSGFGDYLGERFDEDAGQWQELYGKRLELRLGLDLYASGAGAGEEIQGAFDQLALLFQGGGPAGLKLKELSCGETSYDKRSGLFRREVEAVCAAYLYAVAEEGGTFLDFEIRGDWRQ